MMRNDLTVVYYTSNREKESFESKIRQQLLSTIGELPLISVSQKPIKFGENICVGDVGVSEINCRRQLLIGVEASKTKYVCVAEADFLYPKEYFQFIPEKENAIYLAFPVYVLFVQKNKQCIYCPKPRGCEGAMFSSREYLIGKLQTMLDGKAKWKAKRTSNREIPHLLEISRRRKFQLQTPIVTFKTDYQMHRRTPFSLTNKTRELPYWGLSHELRNKYL